MERSRAGWGGGGGGGGPGLVRCMRGWFRCRRGVVFVGGGGGVFEGGLGGDFVGGGGCVSDGLSKWDKWDKWDSVEVLLARVKGAPFVSLA